MVWFSHNFGRRGAEGGKAKGEAMHGGRPYGSKISGGVGKKRGDWDTHMFNKNKTLEDLQRGEEGEAEREAGSRVSDKSRWVQLHKEKEELTVSPKSRGRENAH